METRNSTIANRLSKRAEQQKQSYGGGTGELNEVQQETTANAAIKGRRARKLYGQSKNDTTNNTTADIKKDTSIRASAHYLDHKDLASTTSAIKVPLLSLQTPVKDIVPSKEKTTKTSGRYYGAGDKSNRMSYR